METISIDGFNDYKEFIRFKISQNAKIKAYKTQLAKAAHCHPSHISQVLRSHVNLTPEQAVALAEFWKLPPEETDFFLELVNYERAGTQALKLVIQKRIKNLLDNRKDIQNKFKDHGKINDEFRHLYYSNWIWSAVHVLVSIPGFSSAMKIAERLNMGIEVVEKYLEKLAEMGLVGVKGKAWHVTKNNIYLPGDSFMNIMFHMNWRQRAISSIQVESHDDLHFTNVIAISRQDIEKLKTLLRDYIQNSKNIITHSPEEELICMTCDLFKI